MNLMRVLGRLVRNAKKIEVAAHEISGYVEKLASKPSATTSMEKMLVAGGEAKRSLPASVPKNLRKFYELDGMFSDMGYENYNVLHVDESASYFIVFIQLHLNMKTKVLSSQPELAKLSMKLGTDYESSVYSGNALYQGEPCFILGFPKHEKGKLELSHLLGSGEPKDANDFTIPFAVCQRVDKSIYWIDLVKAGHSKIIGASGSGKSVFLNSLVVQSMKSEKAQLFLIDMKQSEKDWGAVSRELPYDNFGNTFDGAIRVLNNVLELTNGRRTSGNSDPIILIIEEADKMMNNELVDDDNPIDQQFPSKDQHKKLRQQMTLVASELRSLGVICYWIGQGALASKVGSGIISQFKTVYGMTVSNADVSRNATGMAGQNLHLLSGNGDMQVYINGRRVRGNSPFCSQGEAVEAVRNKYNLKGG